MQFLLERMLTLGLWRVSYVNDEEEEILFFIADNWERRKNKFIFYRGRTIVGSLVDDGSVDIRWG